MHFRKTTIGAVAALALIPSAALAATINGGPQGEHLRGTNNADTINGNGGNDRIFGRKGDDALKGGPGNDWINGGSGDDQISGDANNAGDRTSFDRLFGSAGNDTINGGDSRDRVYGGSGNDTSNGENGNDLMAGGTGDDTQHGGNGNDRIFANLGVRTPPTASDGNDDLWALARGDVPGPGVDQVGDTLDGGNGNDRFHTRDGEVDHMTCGDGNDTALLDNVDVITDATAENPKGSCETVVRHAPRLQGRGQRGRAAVPEGRAEDLLAPTPKHPDTKRRRQMAPPLVVADPAGSDLPDRLDRVVGPEQVLGVDERLDRAQAGVGAGRPERRARGRSAARRSSGSACPRPTGPAPPSPRRRAPRPPRSSPASAPCRRRT